MIISDDLHSYLGATFWMQCAAGNKTGTVNVFIDIPTDEKYRKELQDWLIEIDDNIRSQSFAANYKMDIPPYYGVWPNLITETSISFCIDY